MKPFARLGILLKTVDAVAPLVVQHDDFGALHDGTYIDAAVGIVQEIAADHSHPATIPPSDAHGYGIVAFPELGAALEAPANPLPVGLVVPVMAFR